MLNALEAEFLNGDFYPVYSLNVSHNSYIISTNAYSEMTRKLLLQSPNKANKSIENVVESLTIFYL